jgi:hypothetical protein
MEGVLSVLPNEPLLGALKEKDLEAIYNKHRNKLDPFFHILYLNYGRLWGKGYVEKFIAYAIWEYWSKDPTYTLSATRLKNYVDKFFRKLVGAYFGYRERFEEYVSTILSTQVPLEIELKEEIFDIARQEAINSLNDAERDIFLLYLDGKPIDEIATYIRSKYKSTRFQSYTLNQMKARLAYVKNVIYTRLGLKEGKRCAKNSR